MSKRQLSHCFPVNGNEQDPQVQGVAGILGEYRRTLPSIAFSGPTYFGPILQAFKAHCAKQATQTSYNVLLLLTDGVIHDMPLTKELIVDLCQFACSVIIIGVGEANFS